jgi:hypothetical protein
VIPAQLRDESVPSAGAKSVPRGTRGHRSAQPTLALPPARHAALAARRATLGSWPSRTIRSLTYSRSGRSSLLGLRSNPSTRWRKCGRWPRRRRSSGTGCALGSRRFGGGRMPRLKWVEVCGLRSFRAPPTGTTRTPPRPARASRSCCAPGPGRRPSASRARPPAAPPASRVLAQPRGEDAPGARAADEEIGLDRR